MKNIIDKITLQIFGELPTFFEEIVGKGVVNLVYKISVKNEDYILRMNKGDDFLKMYQREKWCMDKVCELDILTPKCVSVGQEGDYSFSFQEFIEGVNGTELPEEKERIWLTLGEYASEFNKISAVDYKINFNDIKVKLFSGFFLEHQLFSADKLAQLKARFDETLTWDFKPMLCHGNLHPSNVVVHPSGDVYLIDWGTASGHRVPHGELVDLFAWNTGKNNIEIFLKGYGLSPEELNEMMRDIQTLVLTRLLTVTKWKMERNKNWSELEFVQSVSKEISQIGDLGADILFTKNI